MTQATNDIRLRSQDEIVTRLKEGEQANLASIYRWQVLAAVLDFEHGAAFCNPAATAADWGLPQTPEEVVRDAREYLQFAIDKIRDHRSLSAERALAKLIEWAWLLCRDDALEAMRAAEHKQYGAPKVRAFAMAFGWWPDPAADEVFIRMADGLPCEPDCRQGCAL